jgi:hypothetical protein
VKTRSAISRYRHIAFANFNLSRRSTLGLEKARAGNENGRASGARYRNVQTIEAVQKLHSPRYVFGPRRGHGVDDDGRFLFLELVHRPNADAGAFQPLYQRALGIGDLDLDQVE